MAAPRDRQNKAKAAPLPPYPGGSRNGGYSSRASLQSSSSRIALGSGLSHAENERLVREFLKKPLRFSRRTFLRRSGAAAAALGLTVATPAHAMLGGRAMMMGHGPGIVTVNATVSSNANNLDFRTLILAAGWNGTSPVHATVTINSGVYVGSSSTATSAFTIQGSFPTGSTLSLVNNGHISGAGGAGGGDQYSHSSTINGGTGGTALTVSIAVSITNNGYIWCGGGGGGGGAGAGDVGLCGGGGGGGTVAGGGGPGYTASFTGHAGTATAGGTAGRYSALMGGSGGNPGSGKAGRSGASNSGAGGGGGSPGYGGGVGASVGAAHGVGGLAGYYIVGNSHVTWVATGTRLGRSS